MKRLKSESLHRPFEALKELIKGRLASPESARPHGRPATPQLPAATADDETLFAEAMAGVQPMQWQRVAEDAARPAPAPSVASPGDSETDRLRRLVALGQGFMVADTPEYMEGVGWCAPPEITRRLHRGDFAVQAHVDLHGLDRMAAREAFDAFMQEAVATGKRAVLIIHGRGLSSPAFPVLKTQVAAWLSCGYWRRWVIAFASARLCDGGSGASYVLLRRTPAPKQRRRRKSLPCNKARKI